MGAMGNREGVIWYDGQLISWKEATVHVLSHTLHYGMGVFEGIRAYKTEKGSAIFRLNEHLDRLFNSAKLTGMDLKYSKEELAEAHRAVFKSNHYSECYCRPMAFYGPAKLGIMPDENDVHVIVAAWPWEAYLGESAMENGIRAKVSTFSRNHVNSVMVKAKANGNYLNSIYAKKEAAQQGYDEAIFLDTAGNVAEGTGENIFLVRHGKIITPSLIAILEGITRDSAIILLQEEGLKVEERLMTRDELYIADEIFFTGTAAEITPVTEVDGVKIGGGKRGPVTQQIQKKYKQAVSGQLSQHQDWLSFII